MDNMTANSDPMMEIFLEECKDLVTQYETYLHMAGEKKEYDLTLINEIFRITHTLKADATMMLFECVAVPTRAFERLLYFYRDECSIVNFDEFSDMLTRLIDYVKSEVQSILDGEAADTDGDELKQEFLDYRDKLASGISVEQVENVEKKAKFEIQDEPMRFYIGSATDASPEKKSTKTAKKKTAAPKTKPAQVKDNAAEEIKKDAVGQKSAKSSETAGASELSGIDFETSLRDEQPEDEKQKDRSSSEITWLKDKSSITGDDLEKLYNLVTSLGGVEERMMARFGKEYDRYADVFGEFHEINIALLDWITQASTVPMGHISPKLHKTVSEMNTRLERKCGLVIEGESVLIDRTWMDKISGALVHMLRNSIDHGIESKEKRKKLGKPAEGLIKVAYSQTEREFIIELSDDGSGIDVENLRKRALERGVYEAEFAETPEEIMELMFIPGVSTHEKEGIYSGRGVGMDVVKHNIEELGGNISVKSEIGKGTVFTVSIPLKSGTNGEEESLYEDFDSRR